MPIAKIFPYPGLNKRSAGFLPRLIEVAQSLSTDPNFLLAIMQLESGIDPSATNPTGGATGLIQFMPATARALGTTTAALRAMSDVGQLDFVQRYFQPYRGRLRSAGDVYLVTFYPASLGKGPRYVIGKQGASGMSGKIYEQNKGLDVDHDGLITAGDVTRKAETMYANHASREPLLVPVLSGPAENGKSLLVPYLILLGGVGWLFYSTVKGKWKTPRRIARVA